MATATTSAANNSPLPPSLAVTAQGKLLAACPCLNVKLHLATVPEENSYLAGKELKLGLAGVSVEQKILCSLSISKDQAIVRCTNCDQDVYTFQSDINSVNIESTSLVFVASSVPFSPSNGIIVPSDAVVTGKDIAALLNSPHYSVAFRMVLVPSTLSPTETQSETFTPDQPSTTTTATISTPTPYRPYLDKVRSILDQELEANVNAQQQRAEARIEAYKSQQLIALRQSIENTRRDKERLWARIQDRVTSPPPASSLALGDVGNADGDGSLDVNGTHPFDMPNTLPVRLTSASRVDGAHSSFLDRRKASFSDAAMSLQFREFDDRLASNSQRRKSLAPVPSTTDAMAELTLNNTTANAATERTPLSTSHASRGSGDSDDISGSSTTKSKKKVTIADDVRSVSILEPERDDDYSDLEGEAEDGDDEGVVFDLDEELGFDDEAPGGQDDIGDEQDESDNEEDASAASTNGHGIAINVSSSIPSKSGMVVGSLRANYLKRQKGLEAHRRNLNDSSIDFDSEDDEDDGSTSSAAPMAFFGTSLPIQIQPRVASQLPPPPARTSAIASSLAMPPGSSPAAAMLQRRLSRAYGTEVIPENTGSNNAHAQRAPTSGLAGSLRDASVVSGQAQPLLGATPGTLIIDPLMLLEEEHDNDDLQDRLRKHRQPFSAINHRRDQEKNQQEQKFQDAASWSQRAAAAPSHVSEQEDFEPPHLFSARTYVGSTPWEMPTRITVKSGGMQREGSHLDKQIALEMAKELEKERQEAAAAAAAASVHRSVEKIDETEEEVDEEDQAAAQRQQQQQQQHPVDTEERPVG
ncbi:hypothetical protein BGZ95_000026 [Linnemannia exigua]|uniref:Uncharacterized protein n=1 Tax=Linnemannia exigua TaxID=604196 RepID=A0AAD4DMH5_9FUNG|nr:hypothetical protein BGZ95_000026 [Linnemannia exigua]